MKTKMFIGVALAALIATPTLAATRTGSQGSQAAAHRAQAYQAQAYDAQAYQPAGGGGIAYDGQAAWNGAGVVVSGNRIVGQDPDPNVRLQLQRDTVADD